MKEFIQQNSWLLMVSWVLMGMGFGILTHHLLQGMFAGWSIGITMYAFSEILKM